MVEIDFVYFEWALNLFRSTGKSPLLYEPKLGTMSTNTNDDEEADEEVDEEKEEEEQEEEDEDEHQDDQVQQLDMHICNMD